MFHILIRSSASAGLSNMFASTSSEVTPLLNRGAEPKEQNEGRFSRVGRVLVGVAAIAGVCALAASSSTGVSSFITSALGERAAVRSPLAFHPCKVARCTR